MQTEVTIREHLVHPMDAERWLREWHFDRQRAIRQYHVQFLLNLMRHKRFRSHTPLEVAHYREQVFLIDGYHTLTALAQWDTPLPMILIHRTVEHMADVGQLYGTFNRDLMRTSTDILRGYGLPAQYDFPKDQNEALVAAIKLLLSGFVWDRPGGSVNRIYLKDQEILFNGVCQWMDEAAQFFDDIAGAPNEIRKGLLRAGTLAVALATMRAKPGGAQDFWTMVAHDSAPQADHPAKTLTHFLIGNTVKQARGAIRYARAVAVCWNAWMRGRTLKEVRIPDIAAPIRLEGTPYDGVQVWRYVSEQWEVLEAPVPFDEPFFHRFREPAA